MEKEKGKIFCGCVALSKEQISFLDNLLKCCRYSGGKNFSKVAIIRSLISAVREIDIDLEKIKGEKQLTDRVLQAFCKWK